jgi:large subunit ribosomal protein L23
VVPDATKAEIKQAVELLFEVQVKHVRVCNVKKKARRFKQILGYRKGWKKAYVALKEGFDIDFTSAK